MPRKVVCPCGKTMQAGNPCCARCRERSRCPVCGGARRGHYWCEVCVLSVGLALQINDECPGRRPPEELREALVAYYRGRAERELPLFEEFRGVAG